MVIDEDADGVANKSASIQDGRQWPAVRNSSHVNIDQAHLGVHNWLESLGCTEKEKITITSKRTDRNHVSLPCPDGRGIDPTYCPRHPSDSVGNMSANGFWADIDQVWDANTNKTRYLKAIKIDSESLWDDYDAVVVWDPARGESRTKFVKRVNPITSTGGTGLDGWFDGCGDDDYIRDDCSNDDPSSADSVPDESVEDYLASWNNDTESNDGETASAPEEFWLDDIVQPIWDSQAQQMTYTSKEDKLSANSMVEDKTAEDTPFLIIHSEQEAGVKGDQPDRMPIAPPTEVLEQVAKGFWKGTRPSRIRTEREDVEGDRRLQSYGMRNLEAGPSKPVPCPAAVRKRFFQDDNLYVPEKYRSRIGRWEKAWAPQFKQRARRLTEEDRKNWKYERLVAGAVRKQFAMIGYGDDKRPVPKNWDVVVDKPGDGPAISITTDTGELGYLEDTNDYKGSL